MDFSFGWLIEIKTNPALMQLSSRFDNTLCLRIALQFTMVTEREKKKSQQILSTNYFPIELKTVMKTSQRDLIQCALNIIRILHMKILISVCLADVRFYRIQLRNFSLYLLFYVQNKNKKKENFVTGQTNGACFAFVFFPQRNAQFGINK